MIVGAGLASSGLNAANLRFPQNKCQFPVLYESGLYTENALEDRFLVQTLHKRPFGPSLKEVCTRKTHLKNIRVLKRG